MDKDTKRATKYLHDFFAEKYKNLKQRVDLKLELVKVSSWMNIIAMDLSLYFQDSSRLEVEKELLIVEKKDPQQPRTICCAVVYAKSDQKTEQEIFNNGTVCVSRRR